MNEVKDRKDLKIQALVEKIATLTAKYENDLADARVEITLMDNEINALRDELKEAVRVQEEANPVGPDGSD